MNTGMQRVQFIAQGVQATEHSVHFNVGPAGHQPPGFAYRGEQSTLHLLAEQCVVLPLLAQLVQGDAQRHAPQADVEQVTR
ncbi:hypothetical protein D3C76_1767100 [compost metagenome]